LDIDSTSSMELWSLDVAMLSQVATRPTLPAVTVLARGSFKPWIAFRRTMLPLDSMFRRIRASPLPTQRTIQTSHTLNFMPDSSDASDASDSLDELSAGFACFGVVTTDALGTQSSSSGPMATPASPAEE